MSASDKLAELLRACRARRRRGAPSPPARGRQADGARAHRRCCSIPARFDEIDELVTHRCQRLRDGRPDHPRRRRRLRVTAASTAAWSTPSRRTSPSSAARSRKPTPQKIVKVMDLAMKMGAPIVGPERLAAARASRKACSRSAATPTSSCATRWPRGVVPQISAIMGPCAGGAVYSPAITDFTIMVRDTSYMFVTGPDVVKTVTHEDVTKEAARRRARRTTRPAASRTSPSTTTASASRCIRDAALATCRATTSTIRPSSVDDDPTDRETPELDTLVPASPTQPYDMHDLIGAVVDEGTFLEVHAHFARNLVVGFARLARPTGRPRREPAGAPGRHARHRRVGEGRAVRPLLRRVQHPAGDLRGRARASCPGPPRSTAASSGTARSCSTRSPRPRCRR